jgi:hypothetical protein
LNCVVFSFFLFFFICLKSLLKTLFCWAVKGVDVNVLKGNYFSYFEGENWRFIFWFRVFVILEKDDRREAEKEWMFQLPLVWFIFFTNQKKYIYKLESADREDRSLYEISDLANLPYFLKKEKKWTRIKCNSVL